MKQVSQIALFVAMLATFAGGVFLLLRQWPSGGETIQVVLPTATPEPVVEMKVYVSGAVRRPGVYVLGEGDRIEDAIGAAGGFADDADRDAVNLALRLKDEDHWHIPAKGDTPSTASASTSSGSATSTVSASIASRTAGSGKININSATAKQLEELDGIGPVLAQRIVDYRDANGPFSSMDGLLDVQGIGEKTLATIRDKVDVR
jgi:competence protein ComEA